MQRIISPHEFKQLIPENPWFIQALRTKEINYWNFNICIFTNRKPVFAIRLEDLNSWQKNGYQEIAQKDNFSLIEKSKGKSHDQNH